MEDTTKQYHAYQEKLRKKEQLEIERAAASELDEATMDGLDILEEDQRRRDKEQKMKERKWSLHDVEYYRAELSPMAFAKIQPFIDSAYQRGDFEYPHKMSRAQFRKYLDDKGVAPGPVYDSEEYGRLGQDASSLDGVYALAQDELMAAHREGRINWGPKVEGKSMHRYPTRFADETDEQRERVHVGRVVGLQARAKACDVLVDVKGRLKKLHDSVASGNEDDGVVATTTAAYLNTVVRLLQKGYGGGAEYPLDRVPGWNDIVQERDSLNALCKEHGLATTAPMDELTAFEQRIDGGGDSE
jgi:hypothetical protein